MLLRRSTEIYPKELTHDVRGLFNSFLKRPRLAEDEALATGERNFCPVLQHKDVAHQIDNARVLDVFKIDYAIATGAKELCRIEPLLAVAKRATDEHRRADPVDAAVVAFCFQSQEIGHSEDATFDVVGENNEIVIAKRDIAGELVNHFAGLEARAIPLLDRAEASSVILGKLWFFG
jgi:hypothetical protein